MTMLTIYPAYGRKYATAEAAKVAWNTGKDFGSDLGYLSIRDTNSMIYEWDITVLRVMLSPSHFFLIYLTEVK